jgi:hypothetical protein
MESWQDKLKKIRVEGLDNLQRALDGGYARIWGDGQYVVHTGCVGVDRFDMFATVDEAVVFYNKISINKCSGKCNRRLHFIRDLKKPTKIHTIGCGLLQVVDGEITYGI